MEMFLLSIQLFIDNSAGSMLWFNLEDLIILILFLSIVFNFNTGYYESGDIILTRKAISKHYLKSIFLLDFISIWAIFLPHLFNNIYTPYRITDEISEPGLTVHWVNWIKLLFFLKFSDLKEIYINVEEFIFNEEKYENVLSLLGLFLELICVTHFLACLWIYISSVSTSESTNSWLSRVPHIL